MSSQLWERRFSKCPGGISVKYVGWRFPPKRQKSFVFRTPTRFLIQIFFNGPQIHSTLSKYLISRHYSSLLLTTAHFSSFSTIPGKWKNRGKFREMDSSKHQWRAMTSNQIFTQSTVYLWTNKKDLNRNSCLTWENERNWRFCLCFWRKTGENSPKTCQIRSFSQLYQSSWFRSFTFGWNNFVVCGKALLTVFARHWCALLSIFRDFSRFFTTVGWLKITKNGK